MEPVHHKGVVGIVIHIHTSWPQTWLVLPPPLLPPRTAIVLWVRIIDVGGKTFGRDFEGGEEWGFGVPEGGSVKVRVGSEGPVNSQYARVKFISEVVGTGCCRFIKLDWDEGRR